MHYVVYSSLLNEKKSNEVLNHAESNVKDWWQALQAFVKNLSEKIHKKLIKNVPEQYTPQYKLGVKDAHDILEKLLLSGEFLKLHQISQLDLSHLSDIAQKVVSNNTIALPSSSTSTTALSDDSYDYNAQYLDANELTALGDVA